MTLIITDPSVINYASVQLLKNTRLMLISKSGKFHTNLKNGNRKRMNGNKTDSLFWEQLLGLVKEWTSFFLSLIPFIEPEQKSELLEMTKMILSILLWSHFLQCFIVIILKWLNFDVRHCYSKRFRLAKMLSFSLKTLYTSQFKNQQFSYFSA